MNADEFWLWRETGFFRVSFAKGDNLMKNPVSVMFAADSFCSFLPNSAGESIPRLIA
ncbi:MAG: hypothetical protein ACRC62_39420 [Microcoleus sp.]